MDVDDLDQIEDFYSNELEKVDAEFLEKLKYINKSDKYELEKKLKEKLSKLQKEYEKKMSVFLKKHKSFGNENEGSKSKKDGEEDKSGLGMSKPFNPKGVSLDLGAYEIIKEKWVLFKFKKRIQAKEAWEKFVPNFFKVFFIKLKFFIKKSSNQFVDRFSEFLLWVSGSSFKLFEHIKEFFKNIEFFLEKITSFLSVINNKILRKKYEKGEEESSESEEEKEGPKNSS